jgi:hypothetical protein
LWCMLCSKIRIMCGCIVKSSIMLRMFIFMYICTLQM